MRALAAVEPTAGERRLPAELTLALLHSTPLGLGADEAARRLAAVGPNRIERVRGRPLAVRLLEQFWSVFAVLLWIGGGLAFLAGLPELGWAIFAVIVVNGVFGFLQEYRAERAVEALQELLPRRITVVRDGAERPVPTAELVPGDVVRLEEGAQVPADGQLLDAADLTLDQSALTGESQPVAKRPLGDNNDGAAGLPADRPELVFAGTSVMSGTGTYVVSATGMATEIGAIAHLTLAVGEPPSPLQREMARVTRIVTMLAVAFGVSFFGLGVVTGTVGVHEGLVFALGVIVANVPEGLLPTLTLALALGVQRMARQGSLVKRLSAVETLGATTVICTDKTGTLTENRMAGRAVWASGRLADLTSPAGAAASDVQPVLEAAVLASQATATRGDPTEVALVVTAGRAGVDVEATRAARPLVAAHPFDSSASACRSCAGPTAASSRTRRAPPGRRWPSARRCAGTAGWCRSPRRGARPSSPTTTGSPPRGSGCSPWRPGRCRPGSPPAARRPSSARSPSWASSRCGTRRARRSRRRSPSAGGQGSASSSSPATTASPPGRSRGRSGCPWRRSSPARRSIGWRPRSCRHWSPQAGVLFARTSPAHKLAIVRALEAGGELVAVTGDGVNDAPALKGAAIGVAMGQRGSDVAKEAAVMVITDDNFASIVAAVRQGRAIYANVGKFITYIFASNVPELVPFLAFVFLGIPLPLTVMQILAVDLGTDLLPALALGAERPEPGVMDRPPRPRTERLLSRRRLLHAYGFLGVAEAALALGAFFWAYWLAGWRPGLPMAATGDLYRRATTLTLAGIVAAQVGNVLACRTERTSVFRLGLWSNRAVLLGDRRRDRDPGRADPGAAARPDLRAGAALGRRVGAAARLSRRRAWARGGAQVGRSHLVGQGARSALHALRNGRPASSGWRRAGRQNGPPHSASRPRTTRCPRSGPRVSVTTVCWPSRWWSS